MFSAIGSCGSMEISMNAPCWTGMFCGWSVLRTATCCFARFGADGISVTCSGPPRDRAGTSRNRVRRSNSLHARSVLTPSDESLDGSCPCVRGSQSRNTLGGSDFKHPAVSSSLRLLPTRDWYLRDKWQQERPISLQDSFIIHSRSPGAETPPRTQSMKTWHETLHETHNVRAMA